MARSSFANSTNRKQRGTPTRPPRAVGMGKRLRGSGTQRENAFFPTEDWHEPTDQRNRRYRIVVQSPGPGYVHVVTPDDVRARLAELPQQFLEPLDVVQLSRMTRKKQRFPCYGLQWGSAIYLYPLETCLEEYFSRPPLPRVYQEARMFGGRWEQVGETWKLIWTRDTLRDFYLNNVLIHELGHVLDERNHSYKDRERFAEWFAIEYGYRKSRAG